MIRFLYLIAGHLFNPVRTLLRHKRKIPETVEGSLPRCNLDCPKNRDLSIFLNADIFTPSKTRLLRIGITGGWGLLFPMERLDVPLLFQYVNSQEMMDNVLQ